MEEQYILYKVGSEVSDSIYMNTSSNRCNIGYSKLHFRT
jgi:hypothetical protein